MLCLQAVSLGFERKETVLSRKESKLCICIYIYIVSFVEGPAIGVLSVKDVSTYLKHFLTAG